jgi:DNA-directed RNA polymerase subunit K
MATKLRYNRFERARIIGARALQVSLGAPVLVKVPKEMIDPIRIAMLEFEKNAIPITVRRVDSIREEGEYVERPTQEIEPDLEEAREKALEKAEKAAQTLTPAEIEAMKREKEKLEAVPIDTSPLKAIKKAKGTEDEEEEKEEDIVDEKDDGTGL